MLRICYVLSIGIVAFVALFATWINIFVFVDDPSNRNLGSKHDPLYANYAAAAFVNDLFMFAIAACIFILVEGRRLKMRYAWAYVLLSFAIAISVMFPLFLIARQKTLS